MATLVTRSGKGSPLTHAEVDANFTNLNTDKLELSGGTMTGNLSFGDNDKAIFGAGSDLQIYHDGSNSYISDQGTGNIILDADDSFQVKRGANTSAVFDTNAEVALYHNNSPKLATTSTGVDITGTLTSDGLYVVDTSSFITLVGPASSKVVSIGDGSDGPTNRQLAISSSNNGLTYSLDSTGASSLFGQLNLNTNGSTRINLAANGDISFYEDTGTTAKFFWDASAESLGIGTSSPSQKVTIYNGTSKAALRVANDLNFAGAYLGSASSDNRGGALELISPVDATNSNSWRIANEPYSNSGSLLFSSAGNSTSYAGLSYTERMRIDSSGNVGIGTSSPSATLDVNGEYISLSGAGVSDRHIEVGTGRTGNGNSYIDLISDTTYTDFGARFIRLNGGANTDTRIEHRGTGALQLTASEAGSIQFRINNTERMRIDSSGTLLVGQSSAGGFGSTTGIQMLSDGRILSTVAGDQALALSRTSSDGEILEFYKNSTTVGSIGSYVGAYVYVGSGDTGLVFAHGNDTIRPFDPSTGAERDNAIDMGSAGTRFDDIYATNGTIQTSDQNEKQDIAELSEAEQRVAVAAKGLLRKFRWKDAVAEKGDEARTHFGIIAQDLQAAFAAEGLDAGDYAMFIHTTWTDEETGEERSRMGVRYSELLAFIIAAI